jgi:hypothetical protein
VVNCPERHLSVTYCRVAVVGRWRRCIEGYNYLECGSSRCFVVALFSVVLSRRNILIKRFEFTNQNSYEAVPRLIGAVLRHSVQ